VDGGGADADGRFVDGWIVGGVVGGGVVGRGVVAGGYGVTEVAAGPEEAVPPAPAVPRPNANVRVATRVPATAASAPTMVQNLIDGCPELRPERRLHPPS
jgi:hypothetical protein